MEKQVKVTLVRSSIGCLPKQKAAIAALGLKKINQSKIFTVNGALEGQLALVSHMVKVENV